MTKELDIEIVLEANRVLKEKINRVENIDAEQIHMILVRNINGGYNAQLANEILDLIRRTVNGES